MCAKGNMPIFIRCEKTFATMLILAVFRIES